MTMHRISTAALFVLAGILLVWSGSAAAHHSRAGVYDTDAQLEMEGVVTEWRWVNPHCFLVWESSGTDGATVGWVGEVSSITSMISEGLRRDSFKAGDRITATVSPAVSGAPQGQLLKVVMADGRVLLDRTSDVD